MPAVTILGDASTTTALALATSWPGEDAVLMEVDPTGGSLAAWLDVPVSPSLSSIVAAAHRATSDPTAADRTISRNAVDTMTRRAPGGLRFVPCPVATREAERAVAEARTMLLPSMIDRDDTVALLDLGRVSPRDLPDHVASSSVCVALHRQERSSPRAAAVRLERFAELVEYLVRRRGDPTATGTTGLVVGVIGDRPFDLAEIAEHVGALNLAGTIGLSDDPVAAAVLAGRPGMSERRLRRQPLLRDARSAASTIAGLMPDRSSRTAMLPDTDPIGGSPDRLEGLAR